MPIFWLGHTMIEIIWAKSAEWPTFQQSESANLCHNSFLKLNETQSTETQSVCKSARHNCSRVCSCAIASSISLFHTHRQNLLKVLLIIHKLKYIYTGTEASAIMTSQNYSLINTCMLYKTQKCVSYAYVSEIRGYTSMHVSLKSHIIYCKY